MEEGRAGPDAREDAPLTTASWGQVRRGVAGLSWWWRGVVGADAYERYVAHLRAHHPDAQIPTERQFWKDKYREMDRQPTMRCC